MNKIKQVRQECEDEFGKIIGDISDAKNITKLGRLVYCFEDSQDKLIEAMIKVLDDRGNPTEDYSDWSGAFRDGMEAGHKCVCNNFKKLLQDSLK